jgi:hypothetical protein
MNNLWTKLKEFIIYHSHRHSIWYIIWHTTIIVLGFMFSPLTWWNDLFINIPVAWGVSWLFLKWISLYVSVSKTSFYIVFVFFYWITNIVGFALMHYSARKLLSDIEHHNYKTDVVIALIYTIIVGIIFYTNPHNLLTITNLIPSWVQ